MHQRSGDPHGFSSDAFSSDAIAHSWVDRLIQPVALFLAWLGFAVPAFGQTFTPIRVNAGGPAYTDSAGNTWSADFGFNTGAASGTSAAIAGTSDPTLYRSLRWDAAGGPELQYAFTVPNGVYQLRLLFAETFPPTYVVGARRFSVQVEGVTTFSNVDVYAEAGAATALVKTTTVAVSDGQLNILFMHGVENPFVNAIEIVSAVNPGAPPGLTAVPAATTQINLNWLAALDDVGVVGYEVQRCQGAGCTNFATISASTGTAYDDSGLAASTRYRYRVRATDADGNYSIYSTIVEATTSSGMPFSPIRVNVGGPAYTDVTSNVWSADSGFNTGSVTSTAGAIAGTDDDVLYRTSRWDGAGPPVLEYSAAVPAGTYSVDLHFAETFGSAYAVGRRIFNVEMEGTTVLSNLDVFAEAGASTALIKNVNVQVDDGTLNIRFVHGPIENPFVNAIAVTLQSLADSEAPTQVTNFSVSATSPTEATLSWSSAADNVGVVAYAIERCPGPVCGNFAEIARVAGTAYNDQGLAPGTHYRYRLRAADARGNLGSYSSVASVVMQTGPGADTQPPAAPTNLAAVATANTDVWLTWAGATDNVAVTNYLLERCEGVSCVNFTQIATPTDIEFTDAETLPLTTYRYRLRAQDAAANISAFSTIVNVSTADDNVSPTTPSALVVSALESGQLMLSWTESTDNIAVVDYMLERCAGGACALFVPFASPQLPEYADSDLPANATYRYRVRARDASGNLSGYSNVVSGTTQVAASGPGAVNYTYDAMGRITHVIEPDGSSVQYTYDASGNVTSITRSEP